MKKWATLLAGAGALALSAGASQAADLYTPAPAPVASWTGFSIGVGIGGQFAIGDASAEADWYQAESIPTIVDQYPDARGNVGIEGFFGTVGAGYDFQVGDTFVMGVFGDYSFAKKKSGGIYGDSNTIVDTGEGSYYGRSEVAAEFTMGDSWFVGGRLGYLVNPETLVYGLVGYTEVEMETDFYTEAYENAFIEGFGAAWGDGKDWNGGLTLGAGIEAMFSNNISAKLEYRYTNLGKIGVDDGDCDCSPAYFLDFADASYDPHHHSIRAVVSYRFNMLQ